MAHLRKASYPVCPLCQEHVELETANSDERGRAVHEECYVTHIISRNKGLMTMEQALSILYSDRSPRDRSRRQA
jgi:hypothetical protein